MLETLQIKDVIDIFLVALLFYKLYTFTRGSRAVSIGIGVLLFLVVGYVCTSVFEMQLLGFILDKVMSVGVILVVVIFQDEIRRFFFRVGARNNWGFLKQVESFLQNKEGLLSDLNVMQIVTACRKLSKNKVGALIIIEQSTPLDEYEATGEALSANINSMLIENIFFKNSPLHDGAMIISKNKICAAGCILPVSHDTHIPKHLGLRHRSAQGIAEKTDALAIIVSEETGNVSVAERGALKVDITIDQLEQILSK